MTVAAASSQDSVFAQLDVVDQLLLARRYDQAMVAFLGLLHLAGGSYLRRDEIRAFHHGDVLGEVSEVCQRAAGQWQRLLSSDLDLARIPYNLLLARLDVLHSLLMGTYQGNLDGFVAALHRRTGGRYQVPDLLRLMLAWCPGSRLDWHPFGLHKILPQLVTAQALATLCAMAPVSRFAELARQRAIDFLLSGQPGARDLDRFGFNPMALHAWMRCSYSDHPRKHEIKGLLGDMLAGMTGAPDFQLTTPVQVEGKPVLLVPLELFVRDHAMYRCYAHAIAGAREHFHTVGVGISGLVDDDTRALFDEFETLEAPGTDPAAFRRGFARVQQLIQRRAPAVVWYPGLGMHAFTVALAQRRLAPVQAMSLGHPATSRSPVMDYVLADETRLIAASRFSERAVPLPRGCLRFRMPGSGLTLPARAAPLPADGVVRIAIPSVAQKLTADFVDALRQVERACGVGVRFVFFTGCRGALYGSAVQNLRKELSRADYFPWMDYADYMKELGRCHLHAGTYPFGGTNSLVDSLRLGLPILAWEGEEPHGRIDSDFVRRAGLPETLICHSKDEYVARLSELVMDPEALRRVREAVPAQSAIDTIFHEQGEPLAVGRALAGLLNS